MQNPIRKQIADKLRAARGYVDAIYIWPTPAERNYLARCIAHYELCKVRIEYTPTGGENYVPQHRDA